VRTAVKEFARGGLPLGRAFWVWGILGGAVVNLFATLAAVAVLSAELSPWLAALVFAAPIPWNILLLVGVWRSAQRPEVGRGAGLLAQLGIAVWVMVLCLA
jgi:hypothetical protein